MNTLGKYLTGFIVLASVSLMTVSMMVYSTHKNWRTAAETLKSQLDAARNENQQLENRYNSLDSQLQAEVEAALQDVRKLESERVQLMAQNNLIQKQLEELQLEQRGNTAAVAATQANNKELTEELLALRASLLENQQKRDEAVNTAIAATDELHQAQGKLSTLVERNTQLTQDIAMKTSMLRENGFDPTATPDDVVPQVRGVVSAMRRSAGNQLIEITIGADDGVRKGHTVEIYRGQKYLGRAEIIRTEPDRAVARIIRKFQQGQIQEDDSVATKLRVG